MLWFLIQRNQRKSHPDSMFLTVVMQDQWLLFKKTNKEPSTSVARMQVILQVESLESWTSVVNIAYNYLWFSNQRSIYMKQLGLHSFKTIFRSCFFKGSNKLTKRHLRFFLDRSWGLLYASDHQPICDGSCKTSCLYIYGMFYWRFCSAKKVYPETLKR